MTAVARRVTSRFPRLPLFPPVTTHLHTARARDTQPSRLPVPVGRHPGHCLLVTAPSAHHTTPHHTTPHHTTPHHTTPHHTTPSPSENRAHRPGGDGESCPGGARSLLPGQWGAIFLRGPGAPARGGRGVLPRGRSESPARPKGGPSSSENRAHRPGGDGESCPGGVRSLLPGQGGAIFLRGPGAPARGGRGVLPRGRSESPARPKGGPSSSENRAHRPGGDGESCPGGVQSLLPGQWGATFFREPGAPARGGRGVLPRGCSESPARPMGGHLLQRTGRTGPGGTGSPAQGVFGVSCEANGGPSSSENRAHPPGGDGEMAPPWPGRRLRTPPGHDSPSPPGRCARFSEEDGPPLA